MSKEMPCARRSLPAARASARPDTEGVYKEKEEMVERGEAREGGRDGGIE